MEPLGPKLAEGRDSEIFEHGPARVCGEVPGGRVDRALAAIGRGLLLRTFLASLDRAAADRVMPALVEWRMHDRNHTDVERQRLRRLVQS